MQSTYLEAFSDQPERLLALMLSTPHVKATRPVSSVTIDFTDTEVAARVQRPTDSAKGPQLLATKQTIFDAVLLHHLMSQRPPDFESFLMERARGFSDRAATLNADFRPYSPDGRYPPPYSPDGDSSAFFRDLDAGPGDLEAANQKTRDALAFLETEGLAIDPAFTGSVMVLAGLVPMHFSVRTPKGERVYREIKVNAPLWSLDITRGAKAGRPYTDIEFRFRGIEIIRKAITAMATQYLASEESTRRGRGQPVLKPNGTPDLDAE